MYNLCRGGSTTTSSKRDSLLLADYIVVHRIHLHLLHRSSTNAHVSGSYALGDRFKASKETPRRIAAFLIEAWHRNADGRPIAAGGSHFPIAWTNKVALLNVQNKDDSCFATAVIAALNPAKKNAERPGSYKQHFANYDLSMLKSADGSQLRPIHPTEDEVAIAAFEMANNVCVNILTAGDSQQTLDRDNIIALRHGTPGDGWPQATIYMYNKISLKILMPSHWALQVISDGIA